MARIPDTFEEQVFFTTTKITINGIASQEYSIGTGFVVEVPLNDRTDRKLHLLVSNKHVFVNPQGVINISFNKKLSDGTPDLGNIFLFEGNNFSDIYFEHPDSMIDLACINISNISSEEYNVYYRSIPVDLISDFTEEHLMPGLDVWFVGYPEGRFDVENNLPLLRRGYIASLPKVDFNKQKQFVIDAQVFQGSSGSPVFAIMHGKFKLVGVVTATMIKHGILQSIPTVQKELGIQQILGLGIVIKATSVKELLDIATKKISEILNTK